MRCSDGTLERPSEWRDARLGGRLIASLVLGGTAALVTFLVGIGCVIEGWFTAAAFVYLFWLLLVLATVFGVVIRRPRHREGDIGTAAFGGVAVTEIRHSAMVFHLMTAMVAAMTALTGGGAVAIFLNTRGQGFPGASVIFGIFGLGCAGYLVAVMTGRLRRGSLMLSPDGIRQRGWSFESNLPWAAVAGAKAVHYQFPEILVIAYSNAIWKPRYTTRFFRIDRLPPVPMIEVDTFQFAIDPVLLHHLVSYYANNAETRAELGTDAAISRARARDYP
ncbi:hypothetical protein O4215_21630 [Rhodococcus maanshanensis]|uniref:hypothetical protein n=1 Tax=Rhodococcus maanshanensis TaxID=183556 RepID=UPI0022B55A2C|nr:hypothetical protein [Rhodococcus maanshanensis]MCZ4558166.1 hypothetical protein [Rhodococcus maanshanensis]